MGPASFNRRAVKKRLNESIKERETGKGKKGKETRLRQSILKHAVSEKEKERERVEREKSELQAFPRGQTSRKASRSYFFLSLFLSLSLATS